MRHDCSGVATWAIQYLDWKKPHRKKENTNTHKMLLFYKTSEKLIPENHFLRIEHWNRNGINFIFIDLVSMHGEITYNNSLSIIIKSIPFRFQCSILKK